MKISNIEFTATETAALYAMAGATLLAEGERDPAKKMTGTEAVAYVESLSPQNVLRLALGSAFPIRQRGGARPNTGNRTATDARSA